jgi:precorrin-6B methylase 2
VKKARSARRGRPGATATAGARRPTVEVRQGRGGLELRVEGTLASVYRRGRSLTGPVWWALAAPVLLLARRRRRVLLLGLAAGSVARALRALDPGAEIVGVERDRDVLRAARRHFDLDALRVEVVTGDALAYLRDTPRRFDMVVEDLFVGPSRGVHKPEWLAGEGYRLIGRRLRPGGIVVSNTIHETGAIVRACRPLGGTILSLDVRGHWNRIVVCGRALPPPRQLRQRLRESGLPAAALRSLAVRRQALPAAS